MHSKRVPKRVPNCVIDPQKTLSFRFMAIVSRLQLRYLHRASRNRGAITALYLFLAGVTALSIISLTAILTDLMLLFPPLGPSAFILFYTPLSESASPRNLVLSHTMALVSGLLSLAVADLFFQNLQATAAISMNWNSIIAIAIAMGAASMAMVAFNCIHPPAVATALIGAMGYLNNTIQIVGVLAAVVFLAGEAILFNRILGGLPYPWWRYNPKVDKMYRSLAGHSMQDGSRWQKAADKTFQRR